MEFSLWNWSETTKLASVTIDCNYSTRADQILVGNLSDLLPVNLPGGFWVKAVNLDNKPVWWEGVNFFSGDETSGIHVTNYACGGTTAASWNLQSVVDGIAKARPDVIGIWVGHNEVLGSLTTPHGWYETMRSLLLKIQATMPGVSVFLELGFHYKPQEFLVWEQMQFYLEALAAEFRVAYFSHHVNANRQNAEDWAVPQGIKEPWKAHLNRQGQAYVSAIHKTLLNRRVTVIDGE